MAVFYLGLGNQLLLEEIGVRRVCLQGGGQPLPRFLEQLIVSGRASHTVQLVGNGRIVRRQFRGSFQLGDGRGHVLEVTGDMRRENAGYGRVRF